MVHVLLLHVHTLTLLRRNCRLLKSHSTRMDIYSITGHLPNIGGRCSCWRMQIVDVIKAGEDRDEWCWIGRVIHRVQLVNNTRLSNNDILPAGCTLQITYQLGVVSWCSFQGQRQGRKGDILMKWSPAFRQTLSLSIYRWKNHPGAWLQNSVWNNWQWFEGASVLAEV